MGRRIVQSEHKDTFSDVLKRNKNLPIIIILIIILLIALLASLLIYPNASKSMAYSDELQAEIDKKVDFYSKMGIPVSASGYKSINVGSIDNSGSKYDGSDVDGYGMSGNTLPSGDSYSGSNRRTYLEDGDAQRAIDRNNNDIFSKIYDDIYGDDHKPGSEVDYDVSDDDPLTDNPAPSTDDPDSEDGNGSNGNGADDGDDNGSEDDDKEDETKPGGNTEEEKVNEIKHQMIDQINYATDILKKFMERNLAEDEPVAEALREGLDAVRQGDYDGEFDYTEDMTNQHALEALSDYAFLIISLEDYETVFDTDEIEEMYGNDYFRNYFLNKLYEEDISIDDIDYIYEDTNPTTYSVMGVETESAYVVVYDTYLFKFDDSLNLLDVDRM